MKVTTTWFTLVFTLILNSTFAFSQENIWQNANMPAKSTGNFGLAHFFNAENQALRTKLEPVPNELRGTSDTISLPMPDGSLEKFFIVESSNMEDALAEKFPQIKSFRSTALMHPQHLAVLI